MTAKGYHSKSDIAALLGVSGTEALRIFHSFEARGQLYRFGARVLRVKVRDFEDWAEQKCGRYESNGGKGIGHDGRRRGASAGNR